MLGWGSQTKSLATLDLALHEGAQASAVSPWGGLWVSDLPFLGVAVIGEGYSHYPNTLKCKRRNLEA